jgi:hypothetical protein
MQPPLLNSTGPSYSELFARSAFSQRPFLDGRKFAEEARARGIPVDRFPATQLMRLDAAGALCPIAFSQANYTVETTWLDPRPDVMAWREEYNFAPWMTYAWTSRASGAQYVSEQYSPWQLLYAGEALKLGYVEVPLAALRVPDMLATFHDEAERRQRSREALDERWRPFIKLLVALQTRFWPHRRQRTTLLHPERDMDGEPLDPMEVEMERFNPRAVLVDFGLDFDGLARLYAEVADAALCLDPVPPWHRLAENAPRGKTDALRGDALRARDLYDACYLLRLLYHLATDRWLPRADEIDDVPSSVEAWRRRHLPRADGQRYGHGREELRDALERQGLYPHRLHFVVEGETEEIVLGRLLEALGSGVGYQLTNLRGIDKALQHEALFAAASEYAARTVLIADLEGSLSEALKQLQRKGLLTEQSDVLLWEIDGRPSSFEEANFSADEVAEAIVAVISRRSPEFAISLTGGDITKAFEDAVERAREDGNAPPAYANAVLKYVRDEHRALVSKTELARELGEASILRINEAGSLYNAASPGRPLFRRLWTWLHEAG